MLSRAYLLHHVLPETMVYAAAALLDLSSLAPRCRLHGRRVRHSSGQHLADMLNARLGLVFALLSITSLESSLPVKNRSRC